MTAADAIETAKTRLDEKIAGLARELEDYRAIREVLERNPGVLNGLLAATEAPEPEQRQERKPRHGSLYERAVVFFEGRDNAWATNREIRDGINADRGPLNSMLYVSNKDDFDQRDHPTEKRLKQFRLKKMSQY